MDRFPLFRKKEEDKYNSKEEVSTSPTRESYMKSENWKREGEKTRSAEMKREQNLSNYPTIQSKKQSGRGNTTLFHLFILA